MKKIVLLTFIFSLYVSFGHTVEPNSDMDSAMSGSETSASEGVNNSPGGQKEDSDEDAYEYQTEYETETTSDADLTYMSSDIHKPAAKQMSDDRENSDHYCVGCGHDRDSVYHHTVHRCDTCARTIAHDNPCCICTYNDSDDMCSCPLCLGCCLNILCWTFCGPCACYACVKNWYNH